MPKVRNVSSVGGLVVPAFGLEVPAGGEVDVTDEQAEALLSQPANWELVPEPKPAKGKAVTA